MLRKFKIHMLKAILKKMKRYHGNSQGLQPVVFLFVLIISVPFGGIPAAGNDAINEENIRIAILKNGEGFSHDELQEFDLNNDGYVDVADLVYLFLQQEGKNVVNFSGEQLQTDESAGSLSVPINFSKSFSGTIRYTVGGTALAGTDYQITGLDGEGLGSLEVNGMSADIPLVLNSDTLFEGQESIALSLLPDSDYQLGDKRRQVIILSDDPSGSTAEYLFVLGTKTMGVEGDIEEGSGFPEALFVRKAPISITFTENDIASATLRCDGALGLCSGEDIEATTTSYDSETLNMVFEYDTLSKTFVSDKPITSFDENDPRIPAEQEYKTLHSVLTLTITDINSATDKFSREPLSGTFSLSVSGVLKEGSKNFFEGILLGTLQP